MKRLMLVFVIAALILIVVPVSAQMSNWDDLSTSKELPLADESKPVFTDDEGRLYHEQPYKIKHDVIIIKKGKNRINVRSGPGTGFIPPLGKANQFEVYDYLALEDGWFKFYYHGQVAYIGERFARFKAEGREEWAPEPRRIYVRRKGFFEKKLGVGPFPELPLWVAWAIGIVIAVWIIFKLIKRFRQPRRRSGHMS